MSSARFILTLCLAMLFTGCGGTEVAEEYARKMTTVLATYRSQIEKKIQAEQAGYTALAFAYAADEENRLVQNLDVDRNARASALADDIGQHGVHPTTSETLNRLREYAEDDLAVAEKLLARDMESYRNTLADLESLNSEQQNLEQLKDSLEALAEPKTVVQRLKDAAQFGCEVNQNYQLLENGRVAGDITTTIANLQNELTTVADSDKASLQARITELQTQQKTLEQERAALDKPCA